jgi:hypothetical protein
VTGDEVEEGRLAGAVRADQARDRPVRDGEGDVVDGGDPTEAPRQAANLENRRRPLLVTGRRTACYRR